VPASVDALEPADPYRYLSKKYTDLRAGELYNRAQALPEGATAGAGQAYVLTTGADLMPRRTTPHE
jgi:hypothetical protein